MAYQIRRLEPDETSLLERFLYEAIFVPKGTHKPPYSIIQLPELQVYIEDFGKRPDDISLVAEVHHLVVGAIWVRIMKDYGHIANDIPSLAISVFEAYRGHGIGTNLIKQMLDLLKQKGYKGVSLSVQKANPAVSLYKKLGFQINNENTEEYIMFCQLGGEG